MAATYGKTSPYYSTSQNNGYLDVISFRTIPASTDDLLYQLDKKYEYRPELLSYDAYGDVDLWWVFAVRNKNIIQDPVFDMVAGLKIYIPSLPSLQAALGI
jgi:hypothetical protein